MEGCNDSNDAAVSNGDTEANVTFTVAYEDHPNDLATFPNNTPTSKGEEKGHASESKAVNGLLDQCDRVTPIEANSKEMPSGSQQNDVENVLEKDAGPAERKETDQASESEGSVNRERIPREGNENHQLTEVQLNDRSSRGEIVEIVSLTRSTLSCHN